MTVHLVRHASAGDRNDADPDDSRRSLDERGRGQAQALMALLEGTTIVRFISSPADRCIETIAPLAAERGCAVVRSDALFEGAPIDAAWDVLEGAARAGGDSVLCSHGDLIPELVRRAQGRGMTVPGKGGCSKGSCWSLEWDGERFTTGTYTSIPR